MVKTKLNSTTAIALILAIFVTLTIFASCSCRKNEDEIQVLSTAVETTVADIAEEVTVATESSEATDVEHTTVAESATAPETDTAVQETEPVEAQTEPETVPDTEEPTIPTLKEDEEIALEVANGLWGNGEERREALEKAGYDYDAIQELVNEIIPPDVYEQSSDEEYHDADYYIQSQGWVPDPDGSVITPRGGVNWYFGQYETYYNLPMDGVIKIARAHGIGGEYWVRDDGAKMLGDYIMLATNNDVYPIGTLVPCSLGMGISLDTGTFAKTNPYQVDIAVSW